jgi:hypothetical protein
MRRPQTTGRITCVRDAVVATLRIVCPELVTSSCCNPANMIHAGCSPVRHGFGNTEFPLRSLIALDSRECDRNNNDWHRTGRFFDRCRDGAAVYYSQVLGNS